jgi:hypothetical protein
MVILLEQLVIVMGSIIGWLPGSAKEPGWDTPLCQYFYNYYRSTLQLMAVVTHSSKPSEPPSSATVK